MPVKQSLGHLLFEHVHNTLTSDLVPGDGPLVCMDGRVVQRVTIVKEGGQLVMKGTAVSRIPDAVKQVASVCRTGQVLTVVGSGSMYALNLDMKVWRKVTYGITTPYTTPLSPVAVHEGKMYRVDGCACDASTGHCRVKVPKFPQTPTDDAPITAVDIPVDKSSCDLVVVGGVLHMFHTNPFWGVSQHRYISLERGEGYVKDPKYWGESKIPFKAHNPVVLAFKTYLVVIGGRHHESQVHAYSVHTGWREWVKVPVSLDRGVATGINENTFIIRGVTKSDTDDIEGGRRVCYRLTFMTPEEAARYNEDKSVKKERQRKERRVKQEPPINLLLDPAAKREAREE
ncbi:hypothetical protein KIPB_006204 [Kipferlia bialata]|uniref:Uncharacterized protein n=1 Tax=Kipferlia bialata TaxID=797122 RepID=A0A391P326_9EUKA|nr:hypothetical protein KIPB_006204 [Kipferlia bialata]|eukprot:g6204.t1